MSRIAWFSPCPALLVLGLAACGLPKPPAVAADGDRGASLIQCANYLPPPSPTGSPNPIFRVLVRFNITERGEVTNAVAESSTGIGPELQRKAREAALSCHYEPALENGRPVATSARRYFYFEVPSSTERPI